MKYKKLLIPTFNENIEIEKCIYNIRGQQVMLDSDIAYFFGVETKNLNKQMKRNLDRFPEDFCFQLNSIEFKNLRFQNGTFNQALKGRKYRPYVYTEHGIIALAGVLKSDIAAKMSVEIARKFIQMRKFILENGEVLLALAKLQNRQLEFENETNRKIDEILKAISNADLPKQATLYAGSFYDSYEFVSGLINKVNKSIVLVDPYCDSKALNFIKNKKEDVSITILKSEYAKLSEEDVVLFIEQYGPIIIKTNNEIHDRYLIIDNEECYSLGTSLNYMGKKLSSIYKSEDPKLIDFVMKDVHDGKTNDSGSEN